MQTLLDIHAQIEGGFVEPLDDPNKAVEHAATFAFNVSTGPVSWRPATSEIGHIRHTPIVLGEGYPTIVASVLHRKLPPDTTGHRVRGNAEEGEFEYHVGSNGYGDDFDSALLHAIAAKNGMDINDIWRFVEFTRRILRPGAK